MGWFRGVTTRKAQARTSDRFDFRVFIETDDRTRSVKLPLAKYSVDGAAAEGPWVLLSRCAYDYSSEDNANESEYKLEDDEEESGGRRKSVVVSRGLGVEGGG